jgi:hypothetical protein
VLNSISACLLLDQDGDFEVYSSVQEAQKEVDGSGYSMTLIMIDGLYESRILSPREEDEDLEEDEWVCVQLGHLEIKVPRGTTEQDLNLAIQQAMGVATSGCYQG